MPKLASDDNGQASVSLLAMGDQGELPFKLSVYLAMMMMGLGLLTSWNIVLNAVPYFMGLYSGDVGKNIAFYMTCANSYPGIPILFLMVAFGDRIPMWYRIVVSFILQAVLMALMPALSPLSYWAPLSLVFMNGLVSMVLQSSLFGLQAILPPIMAQAAMGGQGWAGVVSSLIQVLIMAVGESTGQADPQKSAIALFVFAALMLLACGLCFLWLYKQPYTQHYISKAQGQGQGRGAGGSTGHSKDEEEGPGAGGEGEEEGLVAAEGSPSGRADCCARELRVLAKVWRGALGVHLIFLGTFTLFPGVMDSIPYRGGFGAGAAWIGGNGWWQVILLAVFNILDTLGRTLPARLICLPEASLLPLTLLRTALIPWFWACVKGWFDSPASSDTAAVLAVAVLGVTNGYFTSLTLMYAPEHAAPGERQTAGFLLSLCLNMGIVLGSQVALAFT